ncbi:hypothetical protein M0R45_009314 [Rubus argutus]|uniref:Uncharacterized protein n=1 Tax=Rubus argutus TaxID=59490 RepID=A0AAW1Y4J8_RUBAR
MSLALLDGGTLQLEFLDFSLCYFGLVGILGSGGSSLDLGSEDLARLVAGVGDPLGGLTRGTVFDGWV